MWECVHTLHLMLRLIHTFQPYRGLLQAVLIMCLDFLAVKTPSHKRASCYNICCNFSCNCCYLNWYSTLHIYTCIHAPRPLVTKSCSVLPLCVSLSLCLLCWLSSSVGCFQNSSLTTCGGGLVFIHVAYRDNQNHHGSLLNDIAPTRCRASFKQWHKWVYIYIYTL